MRLAFLAALTAVAGVAASSLAIQNTRLEYQVSGSNAETWSSSINAHAGDSIDVRVRVSYTGTAAPLGLGDINFQPTVSHWWSASPADTFTPVANGYGDALPAQTPHGWVIDTPGAYGRIFGFARQGAAPGDTANFLVGMVNLHGATNYLRIAHANVTDWQSGVGINGSGGVDSAQFSPLVRPTTAPAFDNRLTNIVVFKFKITLSSTPTARDLVIDTPAELFGNYNSTTGERQAIWYGAANESSGSIRGGVLTVPATIHEAIPSPGILAVAGAGGLVALPRRRRA
jgi:hypothetical protein